MKTSEGWIDIAGKFYERGHISHGWAAAEILEDRCLFIDALPDMSSASKKQRGSSSQFILMLMGFARCDGGTADMLYDPTPLQWRTIERKDLYADNILLGNKMDYACDMGFMAMEVLNELIQIERYTERERFVLNKIVARTTKSFSLYLQNRENADD